MDKESLGTINVILAAEVLASMALHTLRTKTNLELGFDLNLKFAESCPLENYILFIFALLAAFLGFISDSYIGKFYITLVGMVFTLLALTLFMIPVSVHPITIQWQRWKIISGFFLLLYISTSGIRNAFILEQFPLSADDDNMIRFYNFIFSLMFIRASIRLVPHGLQLIGMNGDISNTLVIIVASLAAFTYLSWLLLASGELYIEPTYFGIWTKCVFCYFASLMTKKGTKEKINYEDGFFIDEPKSDVSFWGYRAIIEKESVFKKISDLKKKDRSIQTYGIFSVKPFFSEYVIWQTIGLRSIIVLLAPGFLMGHFIYVLTSCLDNLSRHTVEFTFFQHLSFTVYELLTIFDILVPLVHFLFIRYIVKVRDLFLILVGYIFLFCAAFTIYSILFYPGFDYNECNAEKGTSSLRFYNPFGSRTNISSDWFDEVQIPSLGNVLIKHVNVKSKKEMREIQVKNEASKIHFADEIMILERATTSYIILKDGVEMNSNKDPSICDFNRLTNASWFFLVSGIKNPDLKLSVQAIETNETIIQLTLDSTQVYQVPSNKRFSVTFERLLLENVTLNIGETLRTAAMYSLFVYEKEKTLRADFVYLEGPLFLPFYLLSIPVLFISTSNSLASVSYFRFVFIESPEKLRSSIFSFIITLNFFSFGLTQTFSYNFDWIYLTVATTVHLLFFIILVFLIIRYKYKLTTYYGEKSFSEPEKK